MGRMLAGTKAHHFYLSNGGHKWRCEAPLGRALRVLALMGDVSEAPQTGKVKGREQSISLVEEQDSGRRNWNQEGSNHHECPVQRPIRS